MTSIAHSSTLRKPRSTQRSRSNHAKPLISFSGLTLVHFLLAVMALEIIAGGIIYAHTLSEQRKLRQQITQIGNYQSVVAEFYNKYYGLPGDLLSAHAERMGLPTGDGMPGHGDGDGNITPCSPDWKEGLGCETVLFWAQLAAAEMIEGKFTAAQRYADTRVQETDLLEYYVPRSTLAEDMFVFVWNTLDKGKTNSSEVLPRGNYFQLTRTHEVTDSDILDEPHSLSPKAAKEIDKKIDDGYPMSGMVMANGAASSEEGGWHTFAARGAYECITEHEVYNLTDYFKANRALATLPSVWRSIARLVVTATATRQQFQRRLPMRWSAE